MKMTIFMTIFTSYMTVRQRCGDRFGDLGTDADGRTSAHWAAFYGARACLKEAPRASRFRLYF